ncbi:MAG: adenosine deaminase [Pseudomonadota bacterium]
MNDASLDMLRRLPKAELHLHIEGSLTPQRLFALAAKNGVTLEYESEAALAAAYDFNNLQEFLDLYYLGMNVLQDEEDFYLLTKDYLDVCRTQNIRYVEIGFDPQGHTERGIAFATAYHGIHNALRDAQREWGLESGLMLNILRHLPQDHALATIDEAVAAGAEIIAIGLDSSEAPFPPQLFVDAFAKARALGWHCVAHAGEEGPPAFVWSALKDLQVERVDHGVRSEEDPALLATLAQRQIPLTVCPLSNVRLAVVDHMRDHNILRLLDAGLLVTVNSDDPAYFGGFLEENFVALADNLDMSDAQMVQLVRNGFSASFAAAPDKARWLAQIDSIA